MVYYKIARQKIHKLSSNGKHNTKTYTSYIRCRSAASKKMRQRQRLKTEGNDMDMTLNWEKSAENKKKPVYCRRKLDARKIKWMFLLREFDPQLPGEKRNYLKTNEDNQNTKHIYVFPFPPITNTNLSPRSELCLICATQHLLKDS